MGGEEDFRISNWAAIQHFDSIADFSKVYIVLTPGLTVGWIKMLFTSSAVMFHNTMWKFLK